MRPKFGIQRFSSLVQNIFKDKVHSSQNMAVFNNWSLSKRHKKKKKSLETVMNIIFWDFLIVYQVFFSQPVKRGLVIDNELPKNWRDRISENMERLGKSQNHIESESSVQSSSQIENFLDTSKKIFKNRNQNFTAVHNFTLKPDFAWNTLSMLISGNVLCS